MASHLGLRSEVEIEGEHVTHTEAEFSAANWGNRPKISRMSNCFDFHGEGTTETKEKVGATAYQKMKKVN